MPSTFTDRDIEHRWESRVLYNHWEVQGDNGAMLYLKKYGKNIGNDKLFALAVYAEGMGYPSFAQGLYDRANPSTLTEQQKRVLIRRALTT